MVIRRLEVILIFRIEIIDFGIIFVEVKIRIISLNGDFFVIDKNWGSFYAGFRRLSICDSNFDLAGIATM